MMEETWSRGSVRGESEVAAEVSCGHVVLTQTTGRILALVFDTRMTGYLS